MDKQRLINDVRAAVEEIAAQCKMVIQMVMASDIGVNPKVGVNTLIDSNIYKEIETSVGDNIEMVQMLVNDYIQYIENGRAPGSWPPPNVIAEWCQRKGIPSDNSTVYLICRSIYLNGIKARPVMENVWERVDVYWNEWADMLFDKLLIQLNEFFNN